MELSSSSGNEEAMGDRQGDRGDRGDGLASSSMASTNSSVSVLPPSATLPPATEQGPRYCPCPSSGLDQAPGTSHAVQRVWPRDCTLHASCSWCSSLSPVCGMRCQTRRLFTAGTHLGAFASVPEGTVRRVHATMQAWRRYTSSTGPRLTCMPASSTVPARPYTSPWVALRTQPGSITLWQPALA